MESKRKPRKRKHSRKPSKAIDEKVDVIEIIFPSQLNAVRTDGDHGLPADTSYAFKTTDDDGVNDSTANNRATNASPSAAKDEQDRPSTAKDDDGHAHIDATYWWRNVTRVLDEAEQERLEEEEMEAAIAAAAARKLHDMRARGRGGRRRSSGASFGEDDDVGFKRSIRFAEEHVHKPLSWSVLGHQVGQAEAVASEILAGIDPDDMYEHVEGPQRDIRFIQRLRLLRRTRAVNDAVEREQARTKATTTKPETLAENMNRLRKQLKRDMRMACEDDFVMPIKIACGEPLIFERFRIVRVLSRGASTAVHLAFDMLEERYCALKSEARTANFRTLQYEWRVWRVLAAAAPDDETLQNIMPKCKFFGRSETRQVLCMNLLGPNLQELFGYCAYQFSMKTLLLITDALICNIFLLHTCGFVHGDIRPENICIGEGSPEQTTRLFLIDLGQARKWSHSRLKKHAKLTISNELVASPNFASLNAHAGFSLSRRDDLISLGYMLIYFARSGSLPWSPPSAHNRHHHHHHKHTNRQQQFDDGTTEQQPQTGEEITNSDIRKMKRSFTGSQQAWMRLCTPATPSNSAPAAVLTTSKLMQKHFAPLMSEYMRIVTSLEYAEKPPYAKLQRIVRSKFAELTYMDDAQFDWIKNITLQTQYEKQFGFQNMPKLRADIADWRKSVNREQQQREAVGGMLAKQHAFKNLAAIMAARLQADDGLSFAA